MSREGKLVKSTAILALGTFFPKLAVFVALPVLTAFLTKEDLGMYEMVFSMVSLILPAATLQVQSAAFRFLIDVRGDDREQSGIITNIYTFVLATSLPVLLIAFFVLNQHPTAVRLAVCAYYFADIMVNVTRQVARGMSRNADYAASCILSGGGQVALICLLVMGLRMGLLGGLLALFVADAASAAFLMYRTGVWKHYKPALLNKKKLGELLGYSWPMVPNSLSQWAIHAADRLIITNVMGLAANAVYSVAYKIPSILSLAQTTFNMAWQENASITAKDADAPAYYSSMFKWLFNAVSGIMSALIGFTPLLFMLFVRGDYAEAYNQIPILFMGMYFLCLSTFWGGIYVATKHTKAAGTTTVTAAAISILVNVVFIRWIGLYAASIASVAAYLSLCVMRAFSVQKIIRISYDFKRIALIVALLAAQCAVCFLRVTVLDVLNFALGMAMALILNWDLLKAMLAKVKKLLRRSSSGGVGAN